ncbi:hypothetical protein RhiJN_09963 [Ceratobasidium sp. AG-Ba]|nr:hypothetical protein RhiJN_09963 [Ceratobasidium sp. AG-Ba]QRW10730.1 hypothetical protein RhiLY_09729 [Ceratobasidium sp. AG-Ba]
MPAPNDCIRCRSSTATSHAPDPRSPVAPSTRPPTASSLRTPSPANAPAPPPSSAPPTPTCPPSAQPWPPAPAPPPIPQGLPPQRRLSSRRASVAIDPWGKHFAEDSHPRTGSSRLTIVRVPSTVDTEDHPNPAPSPGPFGGSGSFRERSHTRRSSWGANSGTSSDGEGEPGPGGRKRSRVSFAFSSFTPIAPVPVPARQGPPSQRAPSPGTGPGFAGTFGPAQGGSGGRPRTRSTGGVDLSSHNPTQDRSGARPPQLSAQQLYDLAMASRDPTGGPRTTPPVPGVSASVEPAHFTALPEGEILPFLDRAKEVEALITTPGTQSHKLFALLGALFPRSTPDDGQTPKNEPTQPMWPPLPGEEKLSKEEQLALASPPLPQPPSSKAAPAEHPLGLPPNSTQWTYAQLVTHLTQTTREQLPDKEWVLFARACIRARSEALWERVKGCLGVPSDIYEDDETEEDEDEDDPRDPRRVGISELEEMSPVVGFRRPHPEDAMSGSSHTGSDEEPEAWVEPVFPSSASGPGSARGSVSNSPTNYFASGVTGLGGGKSDSRSWGGSVSGRSDGGRMELIGEEEEEEEEEDESGEDKDKANKTPEPDSPMVGLRILTAPMSPTYHPAASAPSVPHSSGTSPGFVTPTGGAGTPQAIPVPGSSGPASPVQATGPPSIDSVLGPPMPNRKGGAWVSPLSNTISTGGRGLSGMGGRGAGGGGGGWNSPLSSSGGGWNSPLGRDTWNPVAERGPGNPLFPSSFARLSLGPTLSANNPSLRSPPPAPPSMYPHLRYLRERYKWARPNSENDFAITIASESSDAGGSRRGGR